MAVGAIRLLAAVLPLFAAAPLAARDPQPRDLAIRHVTVVPMTENDVIVRDATVVIQDGRITAIGPSATTRVPAGVRIMNGSGKWLMPALADMHVHVETRRNGPISLRGRTPLEIRTRDIAAPYLFNGILQIFNLSATPEAIAQRNEIADGRVIGPHIALAAMIDGSPPVRPNGLVAATPADGRQIVRDIKVEGYDAVKVYSRLSMESYDAILDEAKLQGLPVLGHLPNAARGRVQDALVPGIRLVAHAEEYAKQAPELSDADVARLTDLAKRSGAWLTATLVSSRWIASQTASLDELKSRPELKYVNPTAAAAWIASNPYRQSATPERLARFGKVVDFNARLVRAFHAAGIPILAGTDAMIPGVIPGFALHEELELLSKAGLPPITVLRSATSLPAEWLGVASDRGTIEPGKRADLLLLDADPVADVANTRRIAALIAGGRYLPRSWLDRELARVAERYANAPKPAGESAIAMIGGHDDEQ